MVLRSRRRAVVLAAMACGITLGMALWTTAADTSIAPPPPPPSPVKKQAWMTRPAMPVAPHQPVTAPSASSSPRRPRAALRDSTGAAIALDERFRRR